MDSTPTDNNINQAKRQKWWVGASISFLIPFLFFGWLVEHFVNLRGQEEVARWSHLVQPSQVSISNQIFQFAFWFIGAGLIAGLAGLLIYYLFTRCRSA